MKRSARWLATLLLMLLLPVQGLAAACAQVCLKQAAQHAMAVQHADGGELHCHDHSPPDGEKPQADGGCCHAHTFMMEPPSMETAVAPPRVHAAQLVARWTSFIPEEPSPPPIAS